MTDRAPKILVAVAVICTYCAIAAAGTPRIISLYAAHTEMLLRLGARDAIIGVSRQETYDGPETTGWEVPAFSIRDDVEKFLVAKPTLILARPQHIAGAGHIVAALERAGISIVALQVVRADELYEYWRRLAGFVGKEQECELLIRHFENTVDAYRSAAATAENRPGVFIEAIHREIKTFTPDSLPAWLVETAGGTYIARDAEAATPGVIIANYGPERLLEKAHAIDIFISQSGAMNRVSTETLLSRSIYQPLAAFKKGRVYSMPEAILARPTPSLLEGLRVIAGWTGLQINPSGVGEDSEGYR